MLRYAGSVRFARRGLRNALEVTAPGYRLYLKLLHGARWAPSPPNVALRNGVLKSQNDVNLAVDQVLAAGLFHHGDAPKTWDSLAAVDAILESTNPGARILDAGAEMYSVLLPWLSLYGYKHLYGVNLVFEETVRKGPITYEQGDITKLKYPDEYFDAIACLKRGRARSRFGGLL